MKKFMAVGAFLCAFCIGLGGKAQASTPNTNDFWTDIGLAASAFRNGVVTNIDVRLGPTLIEGKDIRDRIGGTLKFGYNLPVMGEASFSPWLEPMLGGYYLNDSFYTFDGTMQFKSAWYLGRSIDKNPKDFLYNVAFVVNVEGGIVDNVSDTQWGNFTVPGKKPASGQSVGALYGPGAEIDAPIGSWILGIAYERTKITTLQGATINEFNLKVQKKF